MGDVAGNGNIGPSGGPALHGSHYIGGGLGEGLKLEGPTQCGVEMGHAF